MNAALEIPGADDVVAWFGDWPSFHDAEILELHLNRSGKSWISLHAWRTTGDKDAKGFYVQDKHAIVTFDLEKVQDLDLADFSPQNVISCLDVERMDRGFLLSMGPCYGLAGSIVAEGISVSVRPGKPES